ncbi:MAG: riboflavin kinase [Rikenellaceae bacterium]|nr:riboflavin kinase [Rikenellaceae bacterium]
MEQKIRGTVTGGHRLGRKLGFPTANVPVSGNEGIGSGVYLARVEVAGRVYDGIANLGSRPTVADSPERLLEAYLFDFEGDLYGREITVVLRRFIRPERKFASVEELRGQIARDKATALEWLKEAP